jgi:hypothetical protein
MGTLAAPLQYVISVITRIRRSAGLLLVLFASHLTMVAGGVVCVVPGMQPMAGAVSADPPSPMATMPGMGGMTAENVTAPGAADAMTNAGASTDKSPCSGPASGTCSAAMPCVTALGADREESIARPSVLHGMVETVAALMPASSVSAPDIPPPKA